LSGVAAFSTGRSFKAELELKAELKGGPLAAAGAASPSCCPSCSSAGAAGLRAEEATGEFISKGTREPSPRGVQWRSVACRRGEALESSEEVAGRKWNEVLCARKTLAATCKFY